MLNITRALRNKKKKNDRRSASAVEPMVVQASPMIVQSPNRRSLESHNHHGAPSRSDSNLTPVYIPIVTSDAWTKPAGPSPGVNSPTIPKVSILADEGTTLDRQNVISITKDVQKFLATISELRLAMEEVDTTRPEVNIIGNDNNAIELLPNGVPEEEDEEEMGEMPHRKERNDKVVEKLKELIHTVQLCLQNNPGMQSSELTHRCKELLSTYEQCEHDTGRISECTICNKAVDHLVDSFTQGVSDYMIGDSAQPVEPASTPASVHQHKTSRSQALVNNRALGFSKSYDNLPRFGSYMDLTQPFNEPMVDRIDQALSGIRDGVRVASQYLKSRQKYHNQVVSYLLKRAQIEQRYYTQLGKIVRNTQNAIAELHQQQEFLPLVDVFRSSLEEDSRYAMNCNTTFNLQVGHKIIEQLERKIQECEKMRKELMANWQKELKKITESRMVMKKAKATYRLCGEELCRTKNLLAAEPYGKQADKRKKEIAELETKWVESEQAYKDAVAHCNDCQYQVHATAQKSILCAYRRIVMDFDATMKQGLENYFQLQYNFFRSLPDPLEEQLERTREYEVGNEFLQFIERHPTAEDELEDYYFEEYDPEFEGLEEGEGDARVDSPPPSQTTSSVDLKAPFERPTSPVLPTSLEVRNVPVRNDSPSPYFDKRARPQSTHLESSSLATSAAHESAFVRRNSEKFRDSSYLAYSPQMGAGGSGAATDDPVMSRMGRTHQFKKLRTPSRCRGCDTYVYFHGYECETCYLACHRKCLASLAIRCGNKRLPRKMNTFGVDFHEHLAVTKKIIPIIVTKCINEIDERGLDTQGLYRISSAKSKMERLCQLFESGAERVDLSELPPHLISSCLKLYFRQLPEPLLTFGLYQEFLTFAREASLVLPCDLATVSEDHRKKAGQMLDRLKELLGRLPEQNQLTLARLIYHLHRVGRSDHVKVNCMPPSNLGIVFGPNLMRQREIVPSLALLANMSFQAKAVEIMIAHVHDVFFFPEEDIKQLELETSEDNENGRYQERLVDGVSNNVDNEAVENHTRTTFEASFSDQRTPFNTPPERRKQNVQELTDMWQDFASDGLSPLSSPARSAHSNAQSRMHASPLLTDSRCHEQLVNEEDNKNILPGLISDNRSFSESVLSTLEQRLYSPSNNLPLPPTFESYLTPVQENSEDIRTHSDDDDEMRIVQSACNTLDRPRRRTHSLTKSSSTGFAGDNESEVGMENDSVFHSRTASTASGASRRLLLSSRSEENLLTHSGESTSNNNPRGRGSCAREMDNFELEIRKLVEESFQDDRHSSDSVDSQPSDYKPFQSANVQALLLSESTPGQSYLNRSSSNEVTPPNRSLPRNFRHPNTQYPVHHGGKTSATLPSQGSIESQIRFAIGSPLTSPVSLASTDRNMSTPGSQGSEGFFSESMPTPESTLSWANKSDHNATSSVDSSKQTWETGIRSADGQPNSVTPEGYPEERGDKKAKDSPADDQPQSSTAVANGSIEYRNSVNSVEEDTDDIPLPDDSFSISNPTQVMKRKFSASRDSGLSDSPDPSVDLCLSPGHGFSSPRLATEQLMPPALQGDKNLHSPLHQSTAASDVLKSGQSSNSEDKNAPLPDTAQVCNSSQSKVKTASEDRKHVMARKPVHHVTRILKITPSLSMKLPVAASSDDNTSPPVQRLRMVSPDELASPEDELDSPMKRSRSLAEALTQDIHKKLDEEEEQVGELIVSHTIPSRRLSRARRIELNAADRKKRLCHTRSADDYTESCSSGGSTTSPRSRRTPQFV